MKLTLVCGPEGSPNFCFGTYDENDKNIDFVQSDWDYPGLAEKLGAILPDPDEVGISAYLVSAYNWLSENDGETFDVYDGD